MFLFYKTLRLRIRLTSWLVICGLQTWVLQLRRLNYRKSKNNFFSFGSFMNCWQCEKNIRLAPASCFNISIWHISHAEVTVRRFSLPPFPPASASQQALPPAKDILKGILKKIPKGKRFKRQDWDTTARGRIRVALGVPFIYHLYKKKKAELLKSRYRNVLQLFSVL